MTVVDRDDIRKSSFAPVADARTRILVLGSLPGEASLAAGQYYANPRNLFWRLIGGVIGREIESLGYEARLAALLGAGVGLWDAVGSARRLGSLDSAIREVQANPLANLVSRLPNLRAVAFNGAKSAKVATNELAARDGLALVALPSSSPAHASVSYAAKQAAWNNLRKFLG